MYYSQFQQDQFLNENVFQNFSNGFFVDIGAYDGITQGSNSLFFEELGWSGVCIEPNPTLFKRLKENRKCACLNYAVSDVVGEEEFMLINGPNTLGGLTKNYDSSNLKAFENDLKHNNYTYEYIKVKTEKFNNIINQKRIDYLSIDVEGNELNILKTIDFDSYDIRVMTIESNNFGDRILEFFSDKPYTLINRLGCDDVYVKNTIILTV